MKLFRFTLQIILLACVLAFVSRFLRGLGWPEHIVEGVLIALAYCAGHRLGFGPGK